MCTADGCLLPTAQPVGGEGLLRLRRCRGGSRYQAATSTAAGWACWAVSVFFLAGFRDEPVLPCSAFGWTSFSYFPALMVISVVSDGKAFLQRFTEG